MIESTLVRINTTHLANGKKWLFENQINKLALRFDLDVLLESNDTYLPHYGLVIAI